MERGIARFAGCVWLSRLSGPDGEARGVGGASRRTTPLCWLLALAGTVLLVPRTSQAFKPQTHEAVAIETANQLETTFPGGGAGNLVFKVNGKTLTVPLQTLDVIKAIHNKQSYFLAGALGPDAFPDPISGQVFAHENGTPSFDQRASQVSGRTITQLDIMAKFEQRHSVLQYRAIDFAMDMVQFFNNDYSKRAGITQDEKDQILAFIAGYLSHGVTDSFAHTWVNDLVGDSWDLTKGSGMFGTLTQEVRHVSVESLVDHRAPKTPFQTPGDGGGFGKLELSAPVTFLDAFYSAPTALGGDIHFNIANDPLSFVQYFRNIDLFRGGVVTLYLNAQVALPNAIRSWSRLGFLFDLAEAVNNNTLVQLFFALTDIPLSIANDLLRWAPEGIDTITKLATFGYAHCVPLNTTRVFGPLPFTNSLEDALSYLGGMNARIAAQTERARVGRYNLTRMSECIGEGFTKLEAAQFLPTSPALNTDPCADIVRQGWQDENPQGLGLYRGNIRQVKFLGQEFISTIDGEFLMDLKGAFLGSNPDDIYDGIPDPWKGNAPYHNERAYEAQNLHRSALSNYERVLTYLRFPGLTVEGLKEVFLPSDPGSPSTLDKVDAICADARDQGFQNCLDLVTLPIAATARQLTCTADWATCAAGAVTECARDACNASCLVPGVPCSDICGGGSRGSCVNTCHDVFLWECIHIPIIDVDECAYVIPLGYVCEGICDIFDSAVDCATAAVKEAKCGVEAIVCSLDNIVQTAELHGLGGAILSPVKKFCDTVDAAEAFFACVKGDPNDPNAAAKRHTCIVDACNEVISQAGSSLPASLQGFDCEATYTKIENAWNEVQDQAAAWKSLMQAAARNPEQFVNVTFFEDDIKKDAAYRNTILQTVASKRAALIANPPPSTASPDDVQLYQDEITVLDTITNVANGAPPPPPLTALRLGKAMDALSQQPWPNVLGPTVKRIISDMGPDFNNTFNQVFNSIQGTKLTPLINKNDISAMFDIPAGGVPKNLLPWNSANYSDVCSQNSMTSIYCDVMKSFDDPNCHGPECLTGRAGESGNFLLPTANGWTPGRSIVAFNPYDATKPVQNVLTNFPLAANQTAYDKLYTSIFAVPRVLPGFFGFDDPNNPWTNGGGATLTPNNTRSTEGTGSTDLTGCNYVNVNSPVFRTADLGTVGTVLQIDVFLPAVVNAGDMQISVSIPGANIFNQYLNNGNPVPLRNLPAGWNTLSFPIPANVVTALLGDFAGAQWFLHLNMPNCTAPVGLDNLRFGGTLTPRLIFHIRPSQTYSVDNGALFGFDNINDWTPSGSKSAAPQFIQGTGALAFPAGGYNPVVSRLFSKAEWGAPTGSMSIDVFIPGPQSNRSWYGDVQLYWECQHFSKTFIGIDPLTNGFENEYNSLRYTMPAGLVSFLKSASATETCRVTVAVNTNPGGSVFLDNLGFVQ